MCGISGIVNQPEQEYNLKNLVDMTDAVIHRGPDDCGFCLFKEDGSLQTLGDKNSLPKYQNISLPYLPEVAEQDFRNNKYRVGFGHRRLAIIDLSAAGHLPMCYQNKRYWITFNGEIYNFRELKEELLKFGHAFVSNTDTEVILASYAQWGTDCLKRFRGMWAFCIYDTILREIFLSRDRYGIKPLYYWISPQNTFCFGSEIKQFTFLPGWTSVLNGQRAYDYLMYSLTDHTDETLFKGVFHLPAGHYYKTRIDQIYSDSHGRVKLTKWYQPKAAKFTGTFKEATEKFRSLFKSSVKEHLVSDVAVGSALSGGLDSSAIVCEISNLLKEQGKAESQKTFSYCASDERFNERKWADEVIKVINSEAHFVFMGYQDLFELNELLIWHNDEPAQSQSLLAGYKVFAAAKKNSVKVLINGQGADEYLSGYGALNALRQFELTKKLRFKTLMNELKKDGEKGNRSKILLYYRIIYPIIPGVLNFFFSRRKVEYKRLKTIISFEKLKAKQTHPYQNTNYKKYTVFGITLHQLLRNPLQKYLRYEDRMSMANSIEARVPFLDHRLVEFSIQLPVTYLDGNGESKKIMLHGLSDIIPSAILKRKDKIGFITSEEKWVKQEYTKELRELLIQSIKESKGILSSSAIEYFDKIVKGEVPFDYTYWRLIVFGLWMKIFNVQLPTVRK